MRIQDLAPDLILSNGQIYTMDGADGATGTVDQAVAVRDGCILAVGGDAEIRPLAGPSTQSIDLNGRAVIPSSVVTSSSDVSSTVSANPFVSLYALVTRKNRLEQEIAPDQAISRAEALRTYTVNGTWLTREEALKGSIELGKLADFAVLDRDYFAVPGE